MRRFTVLAACGLAAAHATYARAQSNVDPVNKLAWQENTGWTNWRDANATLDGARFNNTFAQGFVWGENIGWINLGDGTPGAGGFYANATGADAGLNILPDATLQGFAWGENVGWISFGPWPATVTAPRPRVDLAADRLRGFAWGENIGWINLDVLDAGKFVGLLSGGCYANCDNSTGVPVLTPADFVCFLNRFRAGEAYANCDQSTSVPALTPADFVCFLSKFRSGC